ncbi:MAG: hypothetical protein ABIF01_00065, partial [Candidatus Micrarchaeota archaeon]
MDFSDRRLLAVIGIMGIILVAIGGYVIYQVFFSKPTYERDLFSLMPGDDLTSVAYADITREGADEMATMLNLPRWSVDETIDGAAIGFGEYPGGVRIWAAFVRTSMTPERCAQLLVPLLGDFSSETLRVNGRNLLVLYSENDTEHTGPLCLWARDGGISALAVVSDSAAESYCRFQSDFSCRGQLFESSILRIKLKTNESERRIITEAACGGASLSSKNLRYVTIQDIAVGSEEEVWLDEIPCYDSGNLLAKGNKFSGKVFLKYYLESEGPGTPRLAAGDVSASPGSEKMVGVRCIDLLETSYDPAVAMSSLPTSALAEELFPNQGERLGLARISRNSERVVAIGFQRQEADYILISGATPLASLLSGINGSGNLKCITGNQGAADLIEQDGKLACRRVPTGPLSGVAFERLSNKGESFISIAVPKYTSERVERTASELAFGVEFQGSEAAWVNETNGLVSVQFVNRTLIGNESSSTPLQGAKVELYAQLQGSVEIGGLLEVSETDEKGRAVLRHVPLSGGIV